MNGTQIRDLPIQMRAAPVRPESIDAEKRTIEVVFTTGARVARMDWWSGKRYDEELVVSEEAMDMKRLNGGAPVLNAHGSYDLFQQIGVVERAWVENGPNGVAEGRAKLRFSEREDVAPLWRDIAAGIVRNVSVGYQVRKFEITEEDGKPALYRAVEWEPYEISLVPIPADAGAGTRAADPKSGQGRTFPCEFNRASPEAGAQTQEQHMSGKNAPAGNPPAGTDPDTRTQPEPVKAPAAAPVPPASETEIGQRAVAAERKRVAEIGELCRKHKIGDEVRAKMIEDGVAIEAARAQILDILAQGSDASQERATVTITRDEGDTLREGAAENLLHRHNPGAYKLTGKGEQFRGMRLLEMGRYFLEAQGAKTRGLGPMDLAKVVLGMETRTGMLGTSDFPNILANVANKTLRAAYESSPQTFKPWTRQATASDFKTISRTQLSGAPALEKVNEAGEFKRGAISDGKETYQLATYGKIVAITRQALINDDLGAFTRLPALFGAAAADFESDTVWAVITANAAMADGVTLFHSTHKNLSGAGAIAVATLGAAREKLRLQTGLEGRLMNLQGKFLLVPAAIETVAQQYTSQAYVSAKSSDINPFAGTLQVIAEPRLDASSTTIWYMAADPMRIDTIEYSYLEGSQGVYLESRVGFDVDGVELKARLDFAAKAIDWRGLVKAA